MLPPSSRLLKKSNVSKTGWSQLKVWTGLLLRGGGAGFQFKARCFAAVFLELLHGNVDHGSLSQARGSTKDSAVFLGLSFKTQKPISQHDKAPTSLKDLAPFNRQFKPNFTFFLFSSCFYQQFPLWLETMKEPTPRTAGFWRVWGQKCHEGDISV